MLRKATSLLKSIVRKSLQSKGFVYSSDVGPADFRGLVEFPWDALERTNRCPILFDVPLERCRGLGLMAFPCSKDSAHPYIRTLQDYLSGRVTVYSDSALKAYYMNFQPKIGSELLGLSPTENKLLLKPVLWFTEPWIASPSRGEEKSKIRIMRNESSDHGLSERSGGEWNHFGPVSDDRGEFEFRRLISVMASIKAAGYVRANGSDGDICGEILVRDNDYRIKIIRGQHRICALAASGHTKAPVRIDANKWGVIRREDAEHWPAVRSGAFSPAQAREVFDRVFEGRQPSSYLIPMCKQSESGSVEHGKQPASADFGSNNGL